MQTLRSTLLRLVPVLLAAQFQTYRIPGAAVAVVKDGEILLAKGYGYADLEAEAPVDATRTLFRIGSVSKLFTWMAAMQLVEEGRLDLNQDVNLYLAGSDVQVPAAFSEPVTTAHLMHHTAGFEDQATGLRVHPRRAGWRCERQRRGHGPVHDRPAPVRTVGR